MKRTSLLICTILMAVTTFAQDGGTKNIELTDAEQTLVRQNSDFAFNLFRMTRGTENHVISPLSITYALGMLNNGAEGITREEISQVLSGGSLTDYADVATMNAFCRKMLTESALLDKDTRMAIANALYFNGDRNIDKTDDMIHDLLTPDDMGDPNLVSFLLNAICFKGAWENQFDEQLTVNSYFDSGKQTAMMMSQENDFLYAENDLYQSVILPYGNGSYQMTLFLPRIGSTLDDMLAAMDGNSWNSADYKRRGVLLSMPRIETDTKQDLVDIMASLGMKNAFLKYDGHGFLDFCYVGDNEENSEQCWISLMKQKAHLKLDEKGTEAAAATAIGVVNKGASHDVEFIANRPFLYIISERSTGSIFFIGQYMGDTTTGVHAMANDKKVRSNDNAVYDLQGRRVDAGDPSTLKKGIYIIGGKKKVVK